MGYSAFCFSHEVQRWLDAGRLKPGSLLLEFGAQEFYVDDDETRCEIGAFLRKQKISQDAIDTVLSNGPNVSAIFAAFGVKYTAIDVDGAHGSKFFDLNTSEPPQYWRNTFDFINNEGTIEHLVNPINGFHVAHELAKVGGVIRHNFPLIGWREHGFLYPTTKFYAHLIGDNGYELLKAKASLSKSEPFDDPLFKEIWDEALDRYTGVKPTVTNLWGELVYRKTADRSFVIPVDHVDGPNSAKARDRLIENYRTFARSRNYPLAMNDG
jgi:hypothetical protein